MRISSVRVAAFLLVGGCVFVAASCNGMATSNKEVPLIALVNPPIADVPIPVGFRMTEDSTSSVQPATSTRVVDHRYKGSEDVLPIVKFYREQMPAKGWAGGEQTQARGGEFTIHYTKNNEECTITVSPGKWFDNYVRVQINPKDRK